MINFETKQGKFAFVESDKTVNFKYDVINAAKNLTEKQWSKVVDLLGFNNANGTVTYLYANYGPDLSLDPELLFDLFGIRNSSFKTATESGLSLMQSLKIISEFRHDDDWQQLATYEQHVILVDLEDYTIGNWLLIKYF